VMCCISLCWLAVTQGCRHLVLPALAGPALATCSK
jgi:hypothetical protein